MKVTSIISLIFLFHFVFPAFSQKKTSAGIDTLLAKSKSLLESQTDSALKLAFKAAELSGQNNDNIRTTKAFLQVAKAYNILDDADKYVAYAQKALDACSGHSDKLLHAYATYELGKAYSRKGFFDQSAMLFRKAKAASVHLADDELKFLVANALGFSYVIGYNLNTDSAEHYYAIAMDIAEKQKDSLKLAKSYINIANVYVHKKKWDEQLVFLHKALDIYTRKHNLDGMGLANKSIGDVYYYKKENANAIKYYEKEYAISQEMKSNNNIAYAACDLAYMYALEKRTGLLNKYAREARKAAEMTGSFPALKYVGGWLSEAYELTGNTKEALAFYKIYSDAKDSINNRSRIDKSLRDEAQSVFEEKVEQLKLEEEKRNAIAEEKERSQRNIRNILIIGIIISISLLFLTYRNYVQKKKANILVSKQKEEVEYQKQKIEEINKEMTDSINYAKIIQRAILPNKHDLLKIFPDHFVLYKPKSVVSGDFYWATVKHGHTMIAAVDCTGHGVPGALMSMIGVEKLNEAVAMGMTDPSQILSHLNRGVKTSLRQNESSSSTSQDGMDIALCSIDHAKNTLNYAGANRPLWFVRNGQLTEYKPTKSAIGGYTEIDQIFPGTEVRIEKGDTIYIFSDGFADQFGGDKGKKLMTKNLKELLLSIQDIPLSDQEKILDKKLKEWQGDFEQVDDILVIGIRI